MSHENNSPMSAERRVTEREAVLRERKAFETGYRTRGWELRNGVIGGMVPTESEAMLLAAEAARLYPLPTITRPRVVRDPMGKGFEFRAVDGRIEVRCQGRKDGYETWSPFENMELTANRIRIWSDLLANPTEEVEADGSEGISDA